MLFLWLIWGFDSPSVYLPDKVEQECKFHVRVRPFSSEREVDTNNSDGNQNEPRNHCGA